MPRAAKSRAPPARGKEPTGRRAGPVPDLEDAAWGAVDEDFIRKVLVPYKLIRGYCRVTVEGLEHLPGRGAAIVAANHTGWLGLDYANLAMTIHDHTGRIPRGVVHPLWFANARIADAARRLGLVPADKDLIQRMLGQDRLVIMFPEAEQGAFKTSVDVQYDLREFKRGFVRVAMTTGAPIVPAAIIGGEEANPVLSKLPLTDTIFRLPLPRPTNLLPKPVKWRISFLPPVTMAPYREADAGNRELVHRMTDRIKSRIQRELAVQLRKRGHRYL